RALHTQIHTQMGSPPDATTRARVARLTAGAADPLTHGPHQPWRLRAWSRARQHGDPRKVTEFVDCPRDGAREVVARPASLSHARPSLASGNIFSVRRRALLRLLYPVFPPGRSADGLRGWLVRNGRWRVRSRQRRGSRSVTASARSCGHTMSPPNTRASQKP